MNKKTNVSEWATTLKKPKTLAVCAMLAALSVILARFIIPMPNAFTRFSIEAVPIVIAGVLFGPLAGGIVGFIADLVGCLFSGYGYNPLFCVPPILYGVLPGLLSFVMAKKTDILRVAVVFLPPVVIGSILYQSWSLATVYNSKGSFAASFSYFLTTRSIQFAVTFVIDVLLTWLLFRSRLFDRAGLWKTPKEEERNGSKPA
ncbi:MAG: folate family ECF transporter S component [Oscillospiraceae bacterium]|nr:folate family ECF transporter S component [Oscillospiraceae bacterium]